MSACPPEMEKAIGIKFASKPQMLQFLIKEWAKKFKKQWKPNEWYGFYKQRRSILHLSEMNKSELDFEISKHYNSLRYGVK